MNDSHAPRMNEPEEAHGHAEPMPHHKVNYFFIFFALVLLTIATVAIAMVRFQNELANLLLALLIASIKATLVARFFMHLKFEGKLIYVIFFVPLVLCILVICALIPDILLNDPVHHASSSSMHMFNSVTHLFQSAVGAE